MSKTLLLKSIALLCLLLTGAALGDTHTDGATRNLNTTPGSISLGGNDGSVGYSYDFKLPAARGRYQPSLALSYSSATGPGAYGVGWTLSTSFIERNKRAPAGSDGSPTEQLFLSLNGSRSYLAQMPGASGKYRPDVGHNFFEVTKPGLSWSSIASLTAQDSVGNTYTFSCTTGNSSCYRYLLTQVKDVDNNATYYDWAPANAGSTDEAQSLLIRIRTNVIAGGATNASTVELVYGYPNDLQEMVDVNGSVFKVPFLLQAVKIERIDETFHPGQMRTSYAYQLYYQKSAATARSLLSTFEEHGRNTSSTGDLTAPGAAYSATTRFDYTAAPGNSPTVANLTQLPQIANCQSYFDAPVAAPNPCLHTPPGSCTFSTNLRCLPEEAAAWLDVDGDGRPDLVLTTQWWHNESSPGVPSFSGPYPATMGLSSIHPTGEGSSYRWRVTDFNGDGTPDIVRTTSNCQGVAGVSIQFGVLATSTSISFQPEVCLPFGKNLSADLQAVGITDVLMDSKASNGPSSVHYVRSDLIDITGDGIADIVVVRGSTWKVYAGVPPSVPSGTWTFSDTALSIPQRAYDSSGLAPIRVTDPIAGNVLADLIDLNGDGLPDYLQVMPGGWAVAFNNVSTFLAADTTSFNPGSPPTVGIVPVGHSPTCDSYWVTCSGSNGDTNCCAYPCPIAQSTCLMDPSTCTGNFSCGDTTSSTNSLEQISGTLATLLDVDRDGRVDYLSGDGTVLLNHAGLNGSIGTPINAVFSTMRSIIGASGSQMIRFLDGSYTQQLDLDGDGIIDTVTSTRSPDFGNPSYDPATFTWSRSSWLPQSDLLKTVRASSGLATVLTYGTSAQFGYATGVHAHAVLVQSVVSGPGVAPATTTYSYAGPKAQPLWYAPNQMEPLGFTASTISNLATGVTTVTTWPATHAFAHMPLSVQVSAGGSPVALETHSPLALSLQSGSHCMLGTVSPPQLPPVAISDYPIVVYEQQGESTKFEGSVTLASKHNLANTADCSSVDAVGNVLSQSITADELDSTSQTITRSFASNSLCKNCVIAETVIGSGPGGSMTTAKRYHYDAPAGTFAAQPFGTVINGHLNYIEELANGSAGDSSGVWEVASRTSYTTNGNVSQVRRDYSCSDIHVVIETNVYDDFNLQVVRQMKGDDSRLSNGLPRVLITDTSYDAYGARVQVVGPYLGGAAPAGAPTATFVYDNFNRLIAVGRGVSGASVTQATESYSYQAPTDSTRASLTATTFLNGGATVDATGTASPSQSSARLSVSYYDALGRKVETLTQVGQVGSSPVLVSEATEFDSAGRVSKKLDPFYTSGSVYAFLDWTFNTLPSDLHESRLSYDGRNRVVCAAYQLRSGAPLSGCFSSFGENASYARATATSYGTTTVQLPGTPLPPARRYFTVASVPAWRNTGAGVADVQLADASGKPALIRDALGNERVTTYDSLGRPVSLVRYAGSAVSPHENIPSTTSYDPRGRITEETDPAFGERKHAYLPTGETFRISQESTLASPYGVAGVQYNYGALGRQTGKYTFELQGSSYVHKQGAAFSYDEPWQGSSSYPYTLAKLSAEASWEGSSTGIVTTVSYGYDIDGNLVRRDQVFPGGPSGTNSELMTYGNDSRLLTTTISSPLLLGYAGNSVVANSTSDVLGRLTQLDDGAGNIYFQATGAAGQSAGYDALGRHPDLRFDNNHLQDAHSFSVNSNLVVTHSVSRSLGSSWTNDILAFQSPQYQGTKLLGYTDAVAGTTFGYAYDQDGWLNSAAASGGSTAISQSFQEGYGHTRPSGGQLDNIQSVTEMIGGQSKLTTYSYTPNTENAQSLSYSGEATGTDALTYDSTSRGLVTAFQTGAFAYDGENRLIQIRSNSTGASEETLSYDAESSLTRRVFPSADGNSNARYYVGSFLTIVQQGGATWAYAHVHAGGARVASLWSNGASTGGIYYQYDRLGSVISTTVAGGALGVRYRYGTYGVAQVVDGVPGMGTASELGYTGGLRLSEGLIHLQARAYSPALRRFVQPDNVDYSRYSYVRGDPIGYVDPTGHIGEGYGAIFEGIALIAAGATAEVATDGLATPIAGPAIADGIGLITLGLAREAANVGQYIAIGAMVVDAVQSVKDEAKTGPVSGPAAPAGAQPKTEAGLPGSEKGETKKADAGEVGTKTAPVEVPKGTNKPETIDGRDYSGHAVDRMQGRGQTPSVVENTIKTGQASPGTSPGTTKYVDPVNGTTAVVETETGRVITVY